MRRGLSLIEVLLAAAILLTGAGASYLWITQDARAAEDLRTRQEADRLARSLLDRYRVLPAGAVVSILGASGPVTPGAAGDLGAELALGAGAPPETTLEAVPLAGPLGAVAVRAKVPTTRRPRLLATVVSGNPALPRDVATAPGFRQRTQGSADWGSASAWVVDKEEPGRSTRGEAGHTTGHHRAHHPARLAWVDAEYTAPPETAVHGEVEEARRLAGPDGLFSQRHRMPEELAAARAKNLARRWASRVPGPGRATEPEDDEIPDGAYEYSLEVVDLRGDPDEPRLEAVYHLRGGGADHRLTARASDGGTLTRMAGTPVLSQEGWKDDEGRAWTIRRSEALVVAVEARRRALGGLLLLRNLPAPDPGAAGTAMTRAVEAEVRQELTGAAGPAPDPSEVRWVAERFVVRVADSED
jgi:hypothetical protein